MSQSVEDHDHEPYKKASALSETVKDRIQVLMQQGFTASLVLNKLRVILYKEFLNTFVYLARKHHTTSGSYTNSKLHQTSATSDNAFYRCSVMFIQRLISSGILSESGEN
jgi:hypothetical protein